MIESMLLWNRKYTVYIDMSPLKKKKLYEQHHISAHVHIQDGLHVDMQCL